MAGRTDLGDFLRACRAATSPSAVGVADGTGAGRRVRGLRREEVARLAGVSVDYYTRLEQGRHASPSEAVLDALARVFGLDAAARAHLSDLARPARHRAGEPPAQRVRPAMQQMIASMVDHPALIIGRRTDVLASNTLARALLTDWTQLPPRHRNYTRWIFLDPAARAAFRDWPTVAAEVVGTLRRYAGRHPDDPRLTELVDELAVQSPQFRTWWNGHQVHERTHGTKHMAHPAVGPITIRYEALTLPGDEDQTLFIYTADPGSPSHDNLRLLALWAAQQPHPGDRSLQTRRS
ncbi:helix-turn-helix domain-containing protein [Dactylosporangium aurantiacum]|uniref:Helix-turn-helix domain-containing protein n=1 Tax=Dactylosporangium aurantiacum TaxID=35754 RepID=A0A9Q9ISR1_9ACTN|nr:helix-turn-helix transcriptional regulator [Dactylosporangium aurantiacum]MDG6108647.1 helix-turn-helix transcriptional regulator [Dactylosporangium aurantiacum]UWZ59137.1 helix-turn-helix domain-containing protein [Dactylosporangium aurantiacum]